MYRSIALLLTLALFALLSGCNGGGGEDLSGSFEGETKQIGDGTVTSFVVTDEDGDPAEIGIVFTAEALDNLPVDPTEVVVGLPPQAAGTNFDHVSFDWNPAGHPPPGVYDTPHFDIHFYMISQAERSAITVQGADEAKTYAAPSADELPANYMIGPGTGVPGMGAHASDLTSPEFNGGDFTSTFVYGFYDGHMVFAEPMVALNYLQTLPNFSAQLSVPNQYPAPGRYPTNYSVRYDAADDAYYVTLHDLTARN